MKWRKTIIAGCLSTCSLAVVVTMYSGARGEFVASQRGLEVRHSYSNLEQDQRMFAADMRQLRRDLRRRVTRPIISAEREAIVQDWRNIVMDRGLNDPWLHSRGFELVDWESILVD